jgi:hypothetical protein
MGNRGREGRNVTTGRNDGAGDGSMDLLEEFREESPKWHTTGDELVSRWQYKRHRAGDELNGGVDNGKPLLDYGRDEMVRVGAGLVATMASFAALTVFYVVRPVLSTAAAREGPGV